MFQVIFQLLQQPKNNFQYFDLILKTVRYMSGKFEIIAHKVQCLISTEINQHLSVQIRKIV